MRNGTLVVCGVALACAFVSVSCETPVPPPLPFIDVERAVSNGLCLVHVRGSQIDILELNGQSRRYVVPFDLRLRSWPNPEHIAPDATYLVGHDYRTAGHGYTTVVGIGLDGRALWEVPNAFTSQLGISPDGKNVVLADSSDASLSIYDISSAQSAPLGFRGRNAAWAPSGERLAYDDGASVRVYDLLGKTTRDAGPGVEPSWLSDGARLAVRVPDASGTSKIDVIELATGNRTTLFQDAGRQSVPRWSLDGEWMYYTKRVGLNWWEKDYWRAIEPSSVVLRDMRTGAEAPIGGFAKANSGNYTWVKSAPFCRGTN